MAMSTEASRGPAVLGKRRARAAVPALPLYLLGLMLVFAGERIFEEQRLALTGLGVAAVFGATAARFAASAQLERERRRAERMLAALSSVGALALLVHFATSTDRGRATIGLVNLTVAARARIEGASTVAWIILLVVALVPLLFGERALAPMRAAHLIESRRVSSAIASGFTVAVAAVYCVMLTYAAGELEKKADFSYFRAGRPGTSTRKIVAGISEPIRIRAFFSASSEIGVEVEGYLKELRGLSSNVAVEFYDPQLAPAIAREENVTTDDIIVLRRPGSPLREIVSLDSSNPRTFAAKLRGLDGEFQNALLRLLRPGRVAYLTGGHGELDAHPTLTAIKGGRTAKGVMDLLESQNYQVGDLNLATGLGSDIPSRADLVMVLGPTKPFVPAEIDALRRYADRGGKLLLALDPDGGVDLAPLADIVGLAWREVVLANDAVYARRRYNDSDHANLVTNRFSSHASVTTLSRDALRQAVGFAGAAPLEKKEGADVAIDFVVKSMAQTFDDQNANFRFDALSEKRGSYNLVAAVSKPSIGAPPGGDDDVAASKDKVSHEMRAFVLGDADALTQTAFRNPANVLLFLDAVRWLGGDESVSGEIHTTADAAIEHTKEEDLVWFYGVIFGAPGILLGVGLFMARRARGSARRAA